MTKTYYICLIAVSGTGGTIGRELIDAFSNTVTSVAGQGQQRANPDLGLGGVRRLQLDAEY